MKLFYIIVVGIQVFKFIEKIIINACFDSEAFDPKYYDNTSSMCRHYLVERGIGPFILMMSFTCGTQLLLIIAMFFVKDIDDPISEVSKLENLYIISVF